MKKYFLSFVAAGFLLTNIINVFANCHPYTLNCIEDNFNNQDNNACINLSNNLRYRSKDSNTSGEVSDLQSFLQDKGYLSSEPTGYFGRSTENAVKSYQSSKGIISNGIVGALTRSRIYQDTCTNTNNQYSNPNPYPTQNLPLITTPDVLGDVEAYMLSNRSSNNYQRTYDQLIAFVIDTNVTFYNDGSSIRITSSNVPGIKVDSKSPCPDPVGPVYGDFKCRNIIASQPLSTSQGVEVRFVDNAGTFNSLQIGVSYYFTLNIRGADGRAYNKTFYFKLKDTRIPTQNPQMYPYYLPNPYNTYQNNYNYTPEYPYNTYPYNNSGQIYNTTPIIYSW